MQAVEVSNLLLFDMFGGIDIYSFQLLLEACEHKVSHEIGAILSSIWDWHYKP